MVQLGRLPPPGLTNPVIDLTHTFYHLVGPLLLSEEFTLRRGHQDQDQVAGLKGPQLGSPVVNPRLGLLGLPEVFPDDRPHPGHVVPPLFYVVQGGAMWGRLALPCFLGEVQEAAGPSSVQQLEW